MNIKTFYAYAPDDTDDIQLEKLTIFLVAGSCCVAGCVWTIMYLLIFGFGLTAALPFAFVVIVGAAITVCHALRNHRPLIYIQILCIIYITAAIQWSIGSVFDSGFVLVWAFMGPIIALMFFSIRHSAVWLALHLVNIVITVIFEDFFARHGHAVSDGTRIFFFIMNLGVFSFVVFTFASYFVSSAVSERAKADGLLLNILPRKTAEKLKTAPGVIAEAYDDASVLFADIVDFTRYSGTVHPDQLVTKLNDIFLRFDDLADHHGLEKIKTIGDAYMVVGGLPEPRADHLEAIADMALDMQAAIKEVEKEAGKPFALRVGIHRGPVVAGVIGKNKFAYDLWGDTVNVASRMESTAAPGTIQVADSVHDALKDKYRFAEPSTVVVKGKGEMSCYRLLAYT
jgi:adenylate cyclase